LFHILEDSVLNRWVVLAAGVVIQTILGGVYSWSIFVPHLIRTQGLSKGQCGFIFGLTIGVFTLAMIFAGRILTSRGPRFTAATGAILFGSGYVLASFSHGDFYRLLAGISLLAGSGIGFGYVCPLSVGVRWFPDRKGLVTGVSVAGFGGGAILLNYLAQHYLSLGVDILIFFRWLGSIAGITLFAASMFLANPPQCKSAEKVTADYSALRSIPFALMTFGIFCGTFSGLLVVGNLAPIMLRAGLAESHAAVAVSIFAFGNALGRILWGFIHDRIRYRSIPLSLAFFALLLIPLIYPVPEWTLLITTALLGFGFSANFVIYAASISRQFGVHSFPGLYPLCFMGYGFAGIMGPAIGGYLSDLTGSFESALDLSIAVVVLAAILTALGQKRFSSQAEKEHFDKSA
jgi:OFA family oxalate/formate antiporter-like MFS transporter